MHLVKLLQVCLLLAASCNAAVTTITKTSTKSVTVTSTRSITTTAPAVTKTITSTRSVTSISTTTSIKTSLSTITSTKTSLSTLTSTKTLAPSTVTQSLTKTSILTSTVTDFDTTTEVDTKTITACPYSSASSSGGWSKVTGTPTSTTATTACTPIIDLQYTNVPDSAYNLQYFQLQTDMGDASPPFQVSYETDQFAWSYLTFDPSSGHLYDYRDVNPAVYAVIDTTQDPSPLLFDTASDASASNLTSVVCAMPGDTKPVKDDVNAFTCSAGGLGMFLVPNDNPMLYMGSSVPQDQSLNAVDLVATVLNCDDEIPQV